MSGPDPPPAAGAVLGPGLAAARRYAGWLAGAGVARGLLGPREVERLWQRHILNCAAVAELVPAGADVIDVGSGAGLPGIPLALTRGDVTVVLLEPMLRRAMFLEEVVADLGLDPRVRVVRGRAEDEGGRLAAAVVTARAVAPLSRLLGWSWPLVRPGGTLLALKGRSAAAELAQARAGLPADVAAAGIVACGAEVLDEATTVVCVRRATAGPRSGAPPVPRTGQAAPGTARHRAGRPATAPRAPGPATEGPAEL